VTTLAPELCAPVPRTKGAWRFAIARRSWRAAFGVVALACIATAGFALFTLAIRPADGVEAHLLFDAARIREGRELYVDPILGMWDYGPVPARHFVMYTPLYASLLSLFPARGALVAGRALSLGAWYGVLAWLVLSSSKNCRKATFVGSLFVGGVYVLVLFAGAARPDALAVGLSGVAFARSVRRGRVGFVDGALFALAFWVKPNVFGLGLGAMLAELGAHGRDSWRPIASALGVSLAAGAALHFVSHGAWTRHTVDSVVGPMTFSMLVRQGCWRLQFLALPIALCGWCASCGWTRRGGAACLALGGLATGVVWALVSSSKFGSASNYWMEPCVGGVAVLRSFNMAIRPGSMSLAAIGLLQALWTGTASIRSAIEGIDWAPRRAAVLSKLRGLCAATRDDVVMADDEGPELAANGRLVLAPGQLTPLTRLGRYPLQSFVDDVRRPEVVCLVMQSDLLERPLEVVDPDFDVYSSDLRLPKTRLCPQTSAGAFVTMEITFVLE
jgi:hypothetical protein